MWYTVKRQLSDSNIYVVPVSHLRTGIQGPINNDIRLNRKKVFNYYDYSTNYYT